MLRQGPEAVALHLHEKVLARACHVVVEFWTMALVYRHHLSMLKGEHFA